MASSPRCHGTAAFDHPALFTRLHGGLRATLAPGPRAESPQAPPLVNSQPQNGSYKDSQWYLFIVTLQRLLGHSWGSEGGGLERGGCATEPADSSAPPSLRRRREQRECAPCWNGRCKTLPGPCPSGSVTGTSRSGGRREGLAGRRPGQQGRAHRPLPASASEAAACAARPVGPCVHPNFPARPDPAMQSASAPGGAAVSKAWGSA